MQYRYKFMCLVKVCVGDAVWFCLLWVWPGQSFGALIPLSGDRKKMWWTIAEERTRNFPRDQADLAPRIDFSSEMGVFLSQATFCGVAHEP